MNSAFTTFVPHLQTERLLLREYRREDFDAFAAHLATPVTSAHLGPAMRYAFEIRREPKVRALIASTNESSLRVARRLGLAYEAQTEVYGKAVGCYTRERQGSIAG